MDYIVVYVVFSSILVFGMLGLRRVRRQQLLYYVRQCYPDIFYTLNVTEEPDIAQRCQVILRSIKSGTLATQNDAHLAAIYRQLYWLNMVPILILLFGYLVVILQ